MVFRHAPLRWLCTPALDHAVTSILRVAAPVLFSRFDAGHRSPPQAFRRGRRSSISSASGRRRSTAGMSIYLNPYANKLILSTVIDHLGFSRQLWEILRLKWEKAFFVRFETLNSSAFERSQQSGKSRTQGSDFVFRSSVDLQHEKAFQQRAVCETFRATARGSRSGSRRSSFLDCD